MNADGSGERNLRWDWGLIGRAVWSPDGRRITWFLGSQIYVMNSDGSGKRKLTHSAAWSLSPVWSPDGRKIAFIRGGMKSSQIYVMNGDGTGQQRLTNVPGHNNGPMWTPDGRIAFTNWGEIGTGVRRAPRDVPLLSRVVGGRAQDHVRGSTRQCPCPKRRDGDSTRHLRRQRRRHRAAQADPTRPDAALVTRRPHDCVSQLPRRQPRALPHERRRKRATTADEDTEAPRDLARLGAPAASGLKPSSPAAYGVAAPIIVSGRSAARQVPCSFVM